MINKENEMKICGIKTNCNSNFEKRHLKYLVELLEEKFYNERHIQPELLEIIAGLNFAILGNFEATLDEDNDVLDDVKKTDTNLDQLIDYCYKE